jgi:hypothetical protein
MVKNDAARIDFEDQTVLVDVLVIVMFLLFRGVSAVGIIGLVPNRLEVVRTARPSGAILFGLGATGITTGIKYERGGNGTGMNRSIPPETLDVTDTLPNPTKRGCLSDGVSSSYSVPS